MFLRLAEAMRDDDVSPDDLSIRVGLIGGEPRDELTRREIEARLMISVFEHYGTPEVMGSAVGAECQQKQGLHIFEDHVIPEVVDPETDEPVAPGRTGELVLTTLTKEAFPLVRYRTGDIVQLGHADCPCGRTFVRVSAPLGRTDNRLVVDGVTFFPRQVRQIVRRETGQPLGCRIVLTRQEARDRVALEVEVTADVFEDEVRKLIDIKERLDTALHQDLGLNFDIRLVQPSALDPGHREHPGVDDRRS
jgi:phenylacetate-CoA ligase